LRFLFVKKLGWPYLPDNIPFSERPIRLPTVLSQEEVVRLIDSARNLISRHADDAACNRPPSDVTRESWKPTLKEALKESQKAAIVSHP
jgi:hypothetical protein